MKEFCDSQQGFVNILTGFCLEFGLEIKIEALGPVANSDGISWEKLYFVRLQKLFSKAE